MKIFIKIVLLLSSLVFFACAKKNENELRMGLFPNVTHAQGVIAYQMSLEGNDWFKKYLGDDVKITWYPFNAGPTAMNAILSDALDVTYVGPNPAINSFIKSETVRIIAGSADGGSGLVVNPKLDIKTPSDFKGKKIATPQYANTQDVACRAWVIANGMTVNNGAGGDVIVVPTQNPDQLSLFKRGDIEACWTVEPWLSRLEQAGAKMYLPEKDSVTTILVTSAAFLKDKPASVEKIYKAHVELTKWVNENPKEAQEIFLRGFESLTKGKLDPAILASAWPRITFTSKLNRAGIETFVDQSISCGFIKERKDMNALFPKIELK